MHRLFITCLALGLAASSQAVAGSGSFDGVYLGSGIGGGFGHAKVTSTNGNGSVDNGLSGISGNGFVGYGATVLQSIYLGVEGGGDISSFTWSNGGNSSPIDNIKRPYGLTAVGRLGYEFTPQFMLFANGGLAYNDFKATEYTVFSFSSQSKWNPGYRAGGGGEYNLGNGIFARLSYDADYNKFTFEGLPAQPKVTVVSQTAKLGVGYRF